MLDQVHAFGAASGRALVWFVVLFAAHTMVVFGQHNQLVLSMQQGALLAAFCAICYLIGFRVYISASFWHVIRFGLRSRWGSGVLAAAVVTGFVLWFGGIGYMLVNGTGPEHFVPSSDLLAFTVPAALIAAANVLFGYFVDVCQLGRNPFHA